MLSVSTVQHSDLASIKPGKSQIYLIIMFWLTHHYSKEILGSQSLANPGKRVNGKTTVADSEYRAR